MGRGIRMPTVSVVIPTYNTAGYVTRAVDSVLAQTYQDLEIIVVDDGSTDATRERLAPYGNRIHYLYQENQERAAARNTGIRYAQGEYVAFLDADDYWLPSKLEQQVAAFDKHPETGMVYSQVYVVDRHGHCLHTSGRGTGGKPELPPTIFCKLLVGNLVPSPTPLIRRDGIEKIGGFDTEVIPCEDHDYWVRLSRHFSIIGLEQPLACYQPSGPALLRKMAAKNAQDAVVRLVEKQRDASLCPPSNWSLALALAWFTGAIVDLGLGRIAEGQARLDKALVGEPHLLVIHRDRVLDILGNLAAQLCEGEPSARAGECFVRAVCAALPPALRPAIPMHQALGQLYAIRFYQANWRDDRRSVLASLGPMVLHNPRWLGNRGTWSVAFCALVGRFGNESRALHQQ